MEVSNNTNTYQALSTQQKPITTPVEPQEPKYTNGEIYEASQGNAIRNDEGKVVLTPQGQNNVNNKQAATLAEDEEAKVAQRDEQRATGTDYLAYQSQKSQVEIYLAVATDNKVNLGDDDTASIIETLRDVQKQNNAVEAYATYKENQDSSTIAHF